VGRAIAAKKNLLCEWDSRSIVSGEAYELEIVILESNTPKEHVYLVIALTQKYSVLKVMGFLKEKICQNLFDRYVYLDRTWS
jgi:REP element-mobilizing transposase RayT